MQHWQREMAGEMAPHSCVCRARQPDILMSLHVDDPRALGGLTDQQVSAAETKRLQ